LNLIRLGLLGQTLSLGAIAWFVAGPRGVAPGLVEGVEPYVWGGLGLSFVGLFGGVLAVRSRWRSAASAADKRSANIIGWALAEAAGLLGAIYLLMVGDGVFFGAGLALQGLASFVLLPLPEP
jgi:hypothetical protein